MKINTAEWQKSRADVFWSKFAPCDHVVQIYDNESVLIDALSGFVGSGINSGDSCIIIATETHRNALETRLKDYGVHVDNLISEKRYFPLDAQETLNNFMVNGIVDKKQFEFTIGDVLTKAKRNNRKVRAFGEMVGLLLAEGNHEATIALERLWDEFCEKHALSLLCAYSKALFTKEDSDTLNHICCSHSKMISGSVNQLKEVSYCEMAKVSGTPLILQNAYLNGGL